MAYSTSQTVLMLKGMSTWAKNVAIWVNVLSREQKQVLYCTVVLYKTMKDFVQDKKKCANLSH